MHKFQQNPKMKATENEKRKREHGIGEEKIACRSNNLRRSTACNADVDNMTPAGLEPAIPGSVGRCLIHWATGPAAAAM